MSSNLHFIIIGAGDRGFRYAKAVTTATDGIVAAVADPDKFRCQNLGENFIWGKGGHSKEGQSFSGWQEFVEYETERRRREHNGEAVPPGVDGAFVCVLDEMHKEVVTGLGPLKLHIMCEKPLASNLQDCIDIYNTLRPTQESRIFSVGHVLRYSPHNVMLRKLLVEDRVIGDIGSVVHTEPVGFWHFAHSYVRGNWRRFQKTGPSLLTKCCHDIDILLWILCSPAKAESGQPHLPEDISSSGGLQFFKKSRKPAAAGNATNCMKCPLKDQGCHFSAQRIYLGDKHEGLGTGNLDWPVKAVVPDIEGFGTTDDRVAAMTRALQEDYESGTLSATDIHSRNWYGRCVFEADNDVCDEQFVTISWPETATMPAKRATFHMVPHTAKICERYSNYYGEHGEVYADSHRIIVKNFLTGETSEFHPPIEESGHGGGDLGITRQFVTACDNVKNRGWRAEDAQKKIIRCTLEEALRSHAVCFAAEEARLGKKVVNWGEFWDNEVVPKLKSF